MTPERFDLLVVGGGKGGKTLAVQWAAAGRRVVMVERGLIGGSCINIACIPTKTLVRSAEVAELARRAGDFGIRVGPVEPDPVAVRGRKRAVVAEMVERNRRLFARPHLDFVLGEATFVGPRTVAVAAAGGGTRYLAGDAVVINTGTRPHHPPTPGLAAARPLDSEGVQELDHVPDHLLVVGGGYIGCEFAQVFRRLGSRVTLLDRGGRFLPREDADIADALLGLFHDDGIGVRSGAVVERVDGVSGRGVTLTLAGGEAVAGSHLLVAVGRVPNTEGLNLAAAGVEVTDRGYVRVDDRLATTAPGVWAVGDVTGGPQFTHASRDDARVVAANLAGGHRTTAGRLMPYTLFTDPELGRVGPTEADLRAAGRRVRVATLPAAAVPRAVTLGETRGLLKAVADADTGEVLGASLLCHGGGELAAVVQVAMQGRLTAAAVRDTVFSHPTMAEGLGDLFDRLA